MTFRLGFRRSSSGYFCDENTISNGSLIGSGESWNAQCNPSGACPSRTIGDTRYLCTDFSSVEDWSIGENNFTYSFPSSHDQWLVRYRMQSIFRLVFLIDQTNIYYFPGFA